MFHSSTIGFAYITTVVLSAALTDILLTLSRQKFNTRQYSYAFDPKRQFDQLKVLTTCRVW